MATKKDVNFVITDLDDTLWDWLEMWYKSFQPYYQRILEETGIAEELLKADFKKLHQKYGTTEMSFLFRELPSVSEKYHAIFEQGSGERRSIIHEYNSNKKNSLKVYNGVIDTLVKIKNTGAIIVGFTESNVFFTKYRLKHLGLDKILDKIYCPAEHQVPDAALKFYPEEFWDPEKTIIKELPSDTRKPNAKILNSIIDDFKADKSKAIYIGDKPEKDIAMAQQARITSVHASYGHLIDNEKYELLKEVTHWTDEELKREAAFKAALVKIEPADFVISSFSELTDIFNFIPFYE
jgi:phosphoglycolate phosphatase